MASGEKIYVGNGKEHVFQDGGKQIKIRLSLHGMKDNFEKYGWTSDAGKMYINLILNERREKDQFGNTHTLTIDTWKPDSARANNETAAASNNSAPKENQATENHDETPPDFPDDIPF